MIVSFYILALKPLCLIPRPAATMNSRTASSSLPDFMQTRSDENLETGGYDFQNHDAEIKLRG
jgi:hypothetical protein